MKTPAQWAEEWLYGDASFKDQDARDATLASMFAEAMADARRAALVAAVAKLDARAQQLSTDTMQGLRVMRDHARAEAIYCSELVRALLNDTGCKTCGDRGAVWAKDRGYEVKDCPECSR